MNDAPVEFIADSEPARAAADVVDRFLRLAMVPDPEGASAYVGPGMRIRFTGGREMSDPSECALFNARRYAWVRKRFERYEVVCGASAGHAVVYALGSLFGAWPDGTPFEGNRYVDRYELRDGKIVEMSVWNDSDEWLLQRAGLEQ